MCSLNEVGGDVVVEDLVVLVWGFNYWGIWVEGLVLGLLVKVLFFLCKVMFVLLGILFEVWCIVWMFFCGICFWGLFFLGIFIY